MRYGIIGNCKTAALVHETGAIDWLCFPKFDSPSVFARLLDPAAGSLKIKPAHPCHIHQSYIPQTALLRTQFDDGQNAFEVIDFMPRYRKGLVYKKPVEIHRVIRPLKGSPVLSLSYKPRLNYARDNTNLKIRDDMIVASNGAETLYLYSSFSLADILSKKSMVLDQEHFVLLAYHEKFETPTLVYSNEMMERTKEYWEGWSNRCRLPSLFADEVLRSAITLKLLTYEDTGAVVAAVTTSLPEILGEKRNWDYRYCWLRDSSMILESLKSLGHFEEAKGFIQFLIRIFESKQSQVQILYNVDGNSNLDEKILPHLRGYKNSSPVRIGNDACHTRQNDIFGEVLNTIYLYYCHYESEKMPEEVWSLTKFLVNTVISDWQTPDAGIWELRHRRKHFTYSKVLSWVALDRGAKIAARLGKKSLETNWSKIAEIIHKDVCKKGWSKSKKSFTQSYGSAALDASLLQMEHCGFIKKSDPRWRQTVMGCERQLVHNGFAYRYTNADDFGKPKTAFILASLWMAQAFYSLGEHEKGLKLFENILSHSNHLGLLSEDIDVESGELLGNFPQAYSHLAIINAVKEIL